MMVGAQCLDIYGVYVVCVTCLQNCPKTQYHSLFPPFQFLQNTKSSIIGFNRLALFLERDESSRSINNTPLETLFVQLSLTHLGFETVTYTQVKVLVAS
ncbi:hypothetical protein L2E82_40428 [Cichorium intybus]|uniref:Uncharacterized protein n=1 Tax=Cichorium intybus TaxID=13427 RepID=A0ACB9ALX2_CICIN|nr:hypothetical protein L2E82_40428 [Cichorium intybus]